MNEILARIDQNELVKLLQDFVRIPSISGDEKQIAEFDAAVCHDIGLDTRIDMYGNVISVLRGETDGKRIVLNSHLDTVGFGDGWTRDPLGGQVEGNFLYGRGSADCKASMATQIMAVKALKESGVRLSGEIVITHNVEIEAQNTERKGTYKLMRDGFTADMAINGEATDMKICIACEGMIEMLITAIGRRAHGGNPQEGINAITEMCCIIDEINKIKPEYNEYIGSGSIVPGVIQGGERSSIVPDSCSLKVSRFIVPGESHELFLSQVEGIIENLKRENKIYDAKALITYSSNPAIIDCGEDIVRYMIEGHSAIGLNHIISGTPRHADADYLVNMGSIPTVIYGPGRIKLGYVADEYVEISDVMTAAKVYAMTLYNILKC